MSFTRSKSGPARRRGATSRLRAGGLRKSFTSAGKAASERSVPDSLITPSCGNVFEDMGFPPDEARNLLLRADLMSSIEDLIRARKLTQARAARSLVKALTGIDLAIS